MTDDWSVFEIVSMVPILLGTAFAFAAALGILRMPDLFLRMSMTTKAATLGVGTILVGSVIFFDELGIATRAIAIIIFLLLTAPVSAQMIGRAGYIDPWTELWSKTIIDELAGRYDLSDNTLASVKSHRLPGDETLASEE